MFHYVYKLEDPETGEFYFGSRSCECDPFEDKYMGSMVKWKPLKSRLIKTILKSDFNERINAYAYERDIILEHIKNPMNKNFGIPSKNYAVGLPGEKNPFFGKTHTEEARLKISMVNRSGNKNSMWGKHFTDESKQKMRERKLGLYNGANNPRAKKLYQYDVSGNLLKIWDCAKDCVDHYLNEGVKLSRGNVSGSANHNSIQTNKLKRLNKFVFSFVEIYNLERFNPEHNNWDKTKIAKLLNEH